MADELTSRHFRARLAERYGVLISDDEYQSLCEALDRPGAYALKRHAAGSRILVTLPIGTHIVHAIYSTYTRQLITAIKPQREA